MSLESKLSSYDYYLPEELIAQDPLTMRSESRLMVLDRTKPVGEDITHRHFYDIKEYLRPGDCLVINNTKVIPARLIGHKETGAAVEVLLLKRVTFDKETSGTETEGEINRLYYECIVRPGKRLKEDANIIFGDGKLTGRIAEVLSDGNRIVELSFKGIFEEVLDELGEMPLPPYITHKLQDKDRYNTVYAKFNGSAAAPTAGLHFTRELLEEVRNMGVKIAEVTLHVGLGTFRPVNVDDIMDHKMHSEWYEITAKAAEIINSTKSAGGRVIAVGTTSTRTLESAAISDTDCTSNANPCSARNHARGFASDAQSVGGDTFDVKGNQSGRVSPADALDMKGNHSGTISPAGFRAEEEIVPDDSPLWILPVTGASGDTDIFIYPGYNFKIIDGLITNFHLPKSTLLMLVSALAGRERVLKAYSTAVEEKYRFFSFGDAMLII